jgi:aryl-alcohol dehydrogenase-like predicted oxidoreductase
MSHPSRRDFLGRSAAAVGALAAGSLVGAADAPPKLKSGADLVPLGKTGISTSLLGLGTGSVGVGHTSHQVQLGEEGFKKLIGHAYDAGIRYYDVADQYGSHLYLRSAIKELKLPRDKLFLQTKTHASTPEMIRADIQRFREELGVDYIDSLMLHCMTKGGWPTDLRPVMDVMRQAKDKKWLRAVGCTCHGMDPLRAAVKSDWVEINQARINPVGGDAGRMDGTPEQVVECLKAMHAQGKAVLGMKILAEGTLKTPEKRLESLRFVLGLGCVDAFVIGFETTQQIDEIMRLIETALKA